MVIELIRVEVSGKGTFGVLKINGEVFCVTLELPYRNNRSNVSSIPTGVYLCEAHNSPKYGDTFQVKNVPGRSHVLFHGGNVVAHTKGCILLARYFGKLKGNRAVLNSGATYKEFLKKLKTVESFALHITNAF